MRIITMGTGPFAVPTFRWLVDSSHEVPLAVTRPVPAAKGRRKTPANPMRDAANAAGIPVWDPPDINTPEVRTRLQELTPELLIVCDYGQLLSKATLAIAPLGGINLHGSLLPRYRGAAPINWALYAGETTTGVSVIHMSPRMDAGPILCTREVPVEAGEDAVALETRLAELGREAVAEAVAQLEAWDGSTSLGQPQDPAAASRAPRLKKADAAVDWTRTARQIFDQVRAFQPWPGTFTYRGNDPQQRLILDEVAAHEESSTATPGTVLRADSEALCVATGSGILEIRRLQPSGKRIMDAAEYLRGHPLEPGERLGPG